MKQCPQCRQTYDDRLNFCLSDGTTLFVFDDSEKTVIRQPEGYNFAPNAMPSHAPQISTAPPNNSRLLYGVILVLAVLAVGSIVALFYERSRTTALPPSNTQTETAAVEPNRNKNLPATESKADVTPTVNPTIENQKRYIVSSCGSIQDKKAGLEWYVGADRNITWHEAQQWTSALNACGGGWRMPTIEEIRTLYNPSVKAGTGYYTGGKYFPAKIDPVFNAIGGGSWVWSNTQTNAENARAFNLNQGKAVEFSATNTLYSTRSFAVRPLSRY